MTVKIIIEGVAVSPAFSSSARAFIASMPKGVAAFPSPRRFAVMFIHIALKARPCLSMPLKSPPMRTANTAASFSVSPDFSATRISPPQKHIPPQRYIHSSTAFTGSLSTASVSSRVLPVMTEAINEPIISRAKMNVSIKIPLVYISLIILINFLLVNF